MYYIYRVGYYVNIYIMGYINYIYYHGFFYVTSLEVDLEAEICVQISWREL